MDLIRNAEAVNETVEGDGVLRVGGKVVFVPGMMRGESGDVLITAEGKKYSRGKLIALREASPERISPDCPYYGVCGGCSLLHMTRERELSLKKERVRETLSRIGGFPDGSCELTDTVGGMREGYRNKAEFLYEKGKGFGYVGREGGFVPVSSCRLLPPEMNRLIASLVFRSIPGLRGMVVRTNHRGESMLVLRTSEAFSLPDVFLSENRIVSLWKVTLRNKAVHALDGELTHIGGDTHLEDKICGLSFRLSPQAFFQINREIAEKIYHRAVELSGLEKSDLAVDAYSGVGAIGMTAAAHAGNVIGVEIVPEAVEDARIAARNNGICNITFLTGRCETLLPLDQRLKEAKTVFLDPPRKGCGKALLKALIDAKPEKLVYVSCDPATLARDLAALRDNGYTLKRAEPYDMFPGTEHVETVCCLYHQKKDFISVPYEPKNADYLNLM